MLGNLIGRLIPTVKPECLAKDTYGIGADVLCDRCQSSLNPHFPVARKEEIFRLLGWTLQPVAQANGDGLDAV